MRHCFVSYTYACSLAIKTAIEVTQRARAPFKQASLYGFPDPICATHFVGFVLLSFAPMRTQRGFGAP